MPAGWISAGAALLGAVGSTSKAGGSSGGTTEQSKDPWSAAQPWLTDNLKTGESLQNSYQQNPFNAQQKAAYGNLASGNDYINRLTPGLLAQFSQQTGFNRNNPTAKPQPFNFAASASNPQMAQSYGGLMAPSMPQSFSQLPAAPVQKTQGNFDAQKYLAANPDVANNSYWSQRPWDHYNLHGQAEGRTFTAMGS